MTDVLLFARQELLLAVRSRWLQVFAVVFAALALLVAGSGYILSGGHGLQDFARTAEALLQLVLLLIPLTSITFAALALTPERGAAELVYAQPIPRWRILAGRVLGLFAALAAAESIGFGLAAAAIASQAGSGGAAALLIVVAIAIVLTGLFVSIAALLAQGRCDRRARVLATSLVVWFVAVVLYDVAVLAAASLLRSGHASRLLITATLVNPVDAARTVALMAIEGTAAFGAASLALLRFTGGPVAAVVLACTSLLIWIVVPLGLAARKLARADVM